MSVAGLSSVTIYFLACILQGDSSKDRWILVPLGDSVDQNLGVNLITNEINLSFKNTNREMVLPYCSIRKMFVKFTVFNQQMSVHSNLSG